MIEFVAIVSSFNRAALLKDGLSSLCRALADLPLKPAILVLDAGSRDGSQQVVQRAARNAPVEIRLCEKVGLSFAAGVNESIRDAIGLYPSARFFFLFETDNYLASAEPVIQALEFLRKHDTFAAAGFTVRKHDGSAAGFGCPHPRWSDFVLGPHLCSRMKLDRPRLKWTREGTVSWAECDVVYTSPILIRRESWELTGEFDAVNFPFSDCDLDWARRLQRLGLAQAVLETNDVVHDNQARLSAWSAARSLEYHRARLRLLRNDYGNLVDAILPLLFLRHAAELLLAIGDFRTRASYGKAVSKRWTLLWRSILGYR